MAIKFVTGTIGGGKTFWAVNYLLKKWFEFDAEILDYRAKQKLVIISNISDLAIPHEKLDELIEAKGLRQVFCHEFVKSFGCPVIFIIDECQTVDKFHRKYYDPIVFEFFQKSRHSGVDIILITQDMDSVCKELRVLGDYEIKATDRTRRLGSTMRYVWRTLDGEKFKRQTIPFSTSVARCYKSFDSREADPPKSVIWKFALIGLVLVGVFFGGISGVGYYFKNGMSFTAKRPASERKPEAVASKPVIHSSASEALRDVSPSPAVEPKKTAAERLSAAVVDPKSVEPIEKERYVGSEHNALENARKKLVLLREPKSGTDRPDVTYVGCVDNVCSLRQ